MNASAKLEGKMKDKNKDEGEKEEKTHCLCGNSDESAFMICCDHCGIWYHGACLQVTRTIANRIETYACPPCISKDNNLKIIYRTVKKEQVIREKMWKPKKIKKDIKTVRVSEHYTEENDEERISSGCNNCINCFRSANCGKCANCNASMEPCLKRICLQSDWWDCNKKEQKSRNEHEIRSDLYSFITRGKKERMKYTCSTNIGQAVSSIKLQRTWKTSSAIITSVKKTKKKLSRKKKTTIQKRRASSIITRNSMKNEEFIDDFQYTAENRRQFASIAYGLRPPRICSSRKERPKHCQGPGCTNSSRKNSKYCSEECGLNLARIRLRTILPIRAEEFWNDMNDKTKKLQRSKDLVEEQIQCLTLADQNRCSVASPGDQPSSDGKETDCSELRSKRNKVRMVVGFRDELQNWLSITEKIEPESDAINSAAEADFVLHCAVCSVEFPGKLIVKHMERCFVRNEKQSCYGTPNKSQVNPYNIFCEQFNKANNTFCKRLRVLCSEHYKPPEDITKICGYPYAWRKSKFRPVIETFDNMQSLLPEGFCHFRRKNCLQHHNWAQNAMGLVDVELLNLLIRLDEWFDKKRMLQVSGTMRGDVLSLLCNKTTSVISTDDKDVQDHNKSDSELAVGGTECRSAEIVKEGEMELTEETPVTNTVQT